MNLFKTLTVGMLAAAMTGMASAQTVIYIAGSTAYRAPVTCAIINGLGGTNCLAAGNNSNLLKASSQIFANGTVTYSGNTFTGTATTIVETNWTGSLAGVVDVAVQNTTLLFPNPQDTTVEGDMKACTVSPFAGAGATATLASGFSTIAHAPQVAMSDAFATSCASALTSAQIKAGQNVGGATTGAQLAALIKGAPLAEAGSLAPIVGAGTSAGYLGVVPFEWVLGNLSGASVPFTNITQQTANFLTKNGFAPFTMFSTLNAASAANGSGDFVYLIGRNEDSGTRIDALAEPQPLTGFGINPGQYLLSFSGGSVTTDVPTPSDFSQIGGATALVQNMQRWPASASLNTEPNINWASAGGGHGGYAGGGDIASVLGTPVDQATLATNGSDFAPENGGNTFFIGYLGISDAGNYGTTTVNGGTALSYNGVFASTANIQNGSYSFWSYEHMYYLTSGTGSISGATLTFVNGLANNIASTYADYSSNGVAAPTTNGAGVLLLSSAGATTAGNVTRNVEGGNYTLNY